MLRATGSDDQKFNVLVFNNCLFEKWIVAEYPFLFVDKDNPPKALVGSLPPLSRGKAKSGDPFISKLSD